MTISSTTRKAGPFIGTGLQTVFPFTFKVFAAVDVLVVLALTSTGVETPQVLTANYTVLLNADQNASPGGNLAMLVAPPVGTTLTLTSQVAATQSTDLTNAGGFYPKVINDALDRLTILTQQVAEGLSRAVKTKLSDTITPEALRDSLFEARDTSTASASAASASAAAAQSAQTAINHVYRGPLAADPATRVGGAANQIGDEYFNTVANRKMIFRSTGWLDFEVSASASATASEASRQVSVTQAGISTTQAGLSATAKTAAEAARDAATVASAIVSVYPLSGATTVPAGITSGQGYWVQSADGYTLTRYKNVAGVATEDSAIGPVSTTSLQSVATDGASSLDTEVTVDALGNVGSRRTKRGMVSERPNSINPLAFQNNVMHHFLDYGQSLSNGWNSVPVITTSGMFDDVWMFNGGVNTASTSETAGVSMTSLVPYFEQVQGSHGETPNGGRVARMVQILRDRHGKTLREAGMSLLCSSAGKDGALIASLQKGSVFYTRVINQVTQGRALALAGGYAYRFAGLFFDQGQFNSATPIATHLAALQQLQTDLQADIRAITLGTEVVRFFITTPWWDSGLAAPNSHPGSTLSVLAAHQADPVKFILVSPPYQQNTVDGTHWAAFESGLAGAYGADAYMEQIIYSGNWNCVEPVSFVVSGAVVTVRFICPGGQLVFDTKQTRLATNFGFLCTDRNGTPYTISSAALSGTDRVVLTLSSAPASGLRVKYADFSTQTSTWGYVGPLRRAYGNRGNLRDNSGDIPGGIYRHPSNRFAPLHRWCVQFDTVVIA